MLMHRQARLAFITFCIIVCAIAFAKVQPALRWQFLGIGLGFGAFLYLLVLSAGVYFIRLRFFLPAVCKVETHRKEIVLTFDDGPMRQHTPALLDLLRDEKVPATFFLIGKNIPGHEDLLKRMDVEGHTVGNHSFEHNFWFDMKSAQDMHSDLKKCDDLIFSAIGRRPLFFRPPYGITNPAVAKANALGGYTPIGWSLRSWDTQTKSSDRLLRYLAKNIQPGGIYLLHDWGPHTLGTLPAFFALLRKEGYRVVALPELIDSPAYV